MHNDIFIISNKVERIEKFIKYYNVYKTDTNQRLNVILDDRNCTYNTESICHDEIEIHYATQVIESTKHLFDQEYLMKILDVYGVAIKWLVFPYIHEVLGLNKAMMMDDDVLLLKPLDHYFSNDYVFYNESSFGNMSKTVEAGLAPIYKDLIDISTMRNPPYFSLNSGQVIHTKNDHYLEFLQRAVCKETYILIMSAVMKYKNKERAGRYDTPAYGSAKNNRVIGGKYWIIEQNIYAIYYKWLLENGYEPVKFGNDVKIIVKFMTEKPKLKSIPAYIHYLPIDKNPLYDLYGASVEELLKKENIYVS